METNPQDFNLSGHLIVCGLGHVGYRTLCLLTQLGEKAVIVTIETGDESRLAAEPQFPIIIGDARDERLLRQAGIETAKGILVVTNDDLANVSIALDARRLNPDIAIVIRLFDQELAIHLEKSIQINRALSASALAAPGFAAAAQGATVRGSFEIDGMTCLLEERGEEDATLGVGQTIQKWSAGSGRAVITHQRGESITLSPQATIEFQPGDRLTCLTVTPGGKKTASTEKSRTGLSALQALAIAMHEWWCDSPMAIRGALIAFLTVVIFSVGLFHRAVGLSVVDSFYFVITTITTVGYGDVNLVNAPSWVKLYDSFLMLCSAAIMATLFSVITDLVLRTRLRDVLARSCSRYKGHVIVAGLDNLGFRLVRELVRNGETVVAIGHDEHGEYLKAIRELATVVLGNARTDETLRKAGVAGAKALIAATDDDLNNLSIGLATKRAHADCRVVLRVFDSNLAGKLQHSLGVDKVLSVSAAAAPTFVGAALCEGVHHGFLLREGLVVIFSETIKAGSARISRAAPSLSENEFALFIKSAGGASYHPAAADALIQVGDNIIAARWLPFKKERVAS